MAVVFLLIRFWVEEYNSHWHFSELYGGFFHDYISRFQKLCTEIRKIYLPLKCSHVSLLKRKRKLFLVCWRPKKGFSFSCGCIEIHILQLFSRIPDTTHISTRLVTSFLCSVCKFKPTSNAFLHITPES